MDARSLVHLHAMQRQIEYLDVFLPQRKSLFKHISLIDSHRVLDNEVESNNAKLNVFNEILKRELSHEPWIHKMRKLGNQN